MSRQLSGGMKRRLMVAKAMVHNPPVLILDEPTAGVDVELRRQLWDYVLELNAQGVTIVLTTHYLEEAQELCDQIAIINRGEVVACEPTADAAAPAGHPQCGGDARGAADGARRTWPASRPSCAPAAAFAVTYKTGQSSVEQVLAAVRAAGVHIKDISTEDPDLEDVFLALTYGDADRGSIRPRTNRLRIETRRSPPWPPVRPASARGRRRGPRHRPWSGRALRIFAAMSALSRSEFAPRTSRVGRPLASRLKKGHRLGTSALAPAARIGTAMSGS